MAISNAFKQQAFLQDTDDVFLVLLSIVQADITTLRVVNNTEDIVSNSNTFTAFPFMIELPDAKESTPPRARLTIDNVSREIAQAIRNMTSVATITIEVIRAAAPDTIEVTFAAMNLRNVKWNLKSVSGDLIPESIEVEPFPKDQFSPSNFPGLFQQ